MRLTVTLYRRYWPNYYWGFGYHFMQNKAKDLRIRHWNYIMKTKGKRKVIEAPINRLPEGVVVHDANEFVKQNEGMEPLVVDHPWPFEKKYIAGSKQDPAYRKEQALMFNRTSVIIEGTNGAMNFANTLLEDEPAPKLVEEQEQKLNFNADFMNIVNNRIDWCRNDDSACIALPRIPEFPRINKRLPRVFGISPVRKEFNTLSCFYDLSELYVSRYYGFIDRRKLISPKAEITFSRDNKIVICDLNCDFITTSYQGVIEVKKGDTTTAAADDNSSLSSVIFPSTNSLEFKNFNLNPSSTIDRSLCSIEPCNWEICFNRSHFYDENVNFLKIPDSTIINTIYLTTGYNHVKKFVDRFFKARVVMFCYGYAVSQARKLYGDCDDYRNEINYKDLEKPITVQCVFFNESKTSIGFAYYQLNTLSFHSSIKNQIWFDGPFDFNTDRELIMKKLINLQLIDAEINHQKTSERLSQQQKQSLAHSTATVNV